MLIIALNTLKEFVRMRVLYAILFVAILLIFFSLVLAELSITKWTKVVIDFSLSIIEFFGIIVTLFLWSYMLYSEISKNTVLLVLSKIFDRKHFIVWKFLWFGILLLIIYVILTIAFVWVLLLHGIDIKFVFFLSIFLSYLKILVVLSFIIFFSTFMSPFISLLISLLVYIISHSTAFMYFYIVELKKNTAWLGYQYLINTIYYIFPNFHDLSMKEFILSPHMWTYTSFHYLLTIFGWAIVYIIVLLFFSVLIFRKKEF